MHWDAQNISVISVAIIIGNNKRIFVYSLNQIINYLDLANMYKCGGATRNFISWSKVNSEKPNFHRPVDFGIMRIQ